MKLREIGIDMLLYSIGPMRWTIDLISFVTDELLELANVLNGNFNSVDAVNEAGEFTIC